MSNFPLLYASVLAHQLSLCLYVRCLLWFDNLANPVLSEISDVYTVWPEYWDFGVKDGIYGPQIITCKGFEPSLSWNIQFKQKGQVKF